MRRLPALGLLVPLLAGCGGETTTAGTASAATASQGQLTLGDQPYRFAVTVCLPSMEQAPDNFLMLGRGTTADQRVFEIQADGNAGRVEMRIKDQDGNPIEIYASAFQQPANMSMREARLRATGPFLNVTQGGMLNGVLSAECQASS